MAPIVQPINKAQPNALDPAVQGFLQQQGMANQSANWWAGYFNGVNQQEANIAQPTSLPYPYDNLQTAALSALAQHMKQNMGQWVQTVGSQLKTGFQQLKPSVSPATPLSLNNPTSTAPLLPPSQPITADTPLPTVLANPETDYTIMAPQRSVSVQPLQSAATETTTPRQTIDLGTPLTYLPQQPPTVQMNPGYTNFNSAGYQPVQTSNASLLASAFPVATLPNNPLIYATNSPNYTAVYATPPPIALNNNMQQLMQQNIALSQEGLALVAYLQQQQQVLAMQRVQQGFPATPTQTKQSAPTSATTASSAVSKSSQSMPTQATTDSARAKKYEALLPTLQPSMSSGQESSLNKFKEIYTANKSKYEAVAKRLGAPDNLVEMTGKAIWAIHCREGSADFSTYLHNGEKLGQPTTLVPAGINFDNWEDAAVDALKRELPKVGDRLPQSVPEWLSFAELYNGTGYEDKGVPSPYVLAGTSAYQKGKYVADGQYDPNHVDEQLGVATLMTS
jgi:lysozyme family protein